MSARFATGFLPILVFGAIAWTTPAAAHDRYDSEYEHYQRDRQEAQHHRWDDRRESLGHAIGDLFRYGTTDPYSSPEHYFRDAQRDYEHYLRDQERVWDHAQRDRWNSQWNHGDYRADEHYRSDGYYRNGGYGSRDSRDYGR